MSQLILIAPYSFKINAHFIPKFHFRLFSDLLTLICSFLDYSISIFFLVDSTALLLDCSSYFL